MHWRPEIPIVHGSLKDSNRLACPGNLWEELKAVLGHGPLDFPPPPAALPHSSPRGVALGIPDDCQQGRQAGKTEGGRVRKRSTNPSFSY